MPANFLVTEGAGYIGSHTVDVLFKMGFSVVILDSLINSIILVIDRVERIAGKRPLYVHSDVREERILNELFNSFAFDAVIHFAGLKAVSESVH